MSAHRLSEARLREHLTGILKERLQDGHWCNETKRWAATAEIAARDALALAAELARVKEEAEGMRESLIELHRDIENEWRRALDDADANDDDGGHVGLSSFQRAKARGLGDALAYVKEALRNSDHDAALAAASGSPEATE